MRSLSRAECGGRIQNPTPHLECGCKFVSDGAITRPRELSAAHIEASRTVVRWTPSRPTNMIATCSHIAVLIASSKKSFPPLEEGSGSCEQRMTGGHLRTFSSGPLLLPGGVHYASEPDARGDAREKPEKPSFRTPRPLSVRMRKRVPLSGAVVSSPLTPNHKLSSTRSPSSARAILQPRLHRHDNSDRAPPP